jgi:hypothetical protein
VSHDAQKWLDARATALLIDKHARQRGNDWWARCPSHEDRKPSLCISQKAGKTLFFAESFLLRRRRADNLDQINEGGRIRLASGEA